MTNATGTIVARLADPGWTPKARDVPDLLGVFGDEDEELVKRASRAILRVDARHRPKVAELVAAATREAVRPARGRLTRFAGDLARELVRDPEAGPSLDGLTAFLVEITRDHDPKTRRAAARALGKLPLPVLRAKGAEDALLAAWDQFPADEDRRPIAEALGKIGGDAARAKLAASSDRAVVRAQLVLERDAARTAPQRVSLSADVAGAGARVVRFHVRRGLEPVAAEEIAERDLAASPPRSGTGAVDVDVRGKLGDVLAVRTALSVALPISPEPIREGAMPDAVARALTRPETTRLLRALTEGDAPIRFRVAFRSGGHQRAAVWRIAELVRGTELVNDPTSSTWEVVVAEANGHVHLELSPRGFEDARFAYRKRTVPASSHPTIAAAIARVSPRREDDVVWDPFVGAGAELVERARIGPYARLVGTDLDEDAVLAARDNVEAAGLQGANVTRGDALATSPSGVTAILTNPPMGRRVQRGSHVSLLERFLHHASDVLVPDGSITWIVPEPRAVEGATRHAGFVVERGLTVDMGGFAGELVVLRRGRGRPR